MGESSGKAPGCSSPECFMNHFHSHSLGRIDHTANLVSRETEKLETRQASVHTPIVCDTRNQNPKGCHDLIMNIVLMLTELRSDSR